MAPWQAATEEALAAKLVNFVTHVLTDERGVRAEDATCLATIARQ